jgi:hypothetical protein
MIGRGTLITGELASWPTAALSRRFRATTLLNSKKKVLCPAPRRPPRCRSTLAIKHLDSRSCSSDALQPLAPSTLPEAITDARTLHPAIRHPPLHVHGHVQRDAHHCPCSTRCYAPAMVSRPPPGILKGRAPHPRFASLSTPAIGFEIRPLPYQNNYGGSRKLRR